MDKEKQYYEITDAFLALKDIDDDEIEGMLRNKHVNEGKSFSISTGSKDLDAARKFIDEDAADGDEIEVIDVDADTVDHIKKNTEYIGQGILCCNRCKANRFIDMDLLVASDVDDEVYNVDDECPHCHDAGSGYSLVGQVGKVEKAKPEEVPEADSEAEVANDEAPAEDEATFDNDVESEDETVDDEVTEEEPEVETFEEEPEDDGMETDTSEDELDDLDLPALGDEVDSDDTRPDDDEDVKESLNEEVQLNKLAEEAWMMNRVISAMNNEDAYYGSWLYIWPDGESREECAYDFGDQESFDELQETFLKTYKYYHADGLYDAAPEVVEYAHMIDSKLGLAKIENIPHIKPGVRESFECSVAGDVFNAITSPEKVDKVIIIDMSGDEAREIFKGSKEDVPMNVIGSPCKSFDVADGYLSCNIDSDVENTNRPLNKALECFSDDKTDKVLVWDQAKGEEVFSGTKAEACDKFGGCEFISFETPAVIRITIDNPSLLSSDELKEVEPETDVQKLIKNIIDANNLSQYKTDKPNTNEFWIRACLEDMDDVELIYESFVKLTENKALIKEFKAVTGYTNALEEAFEAGFKAANEELGINENDSPIVESESNDVEEVIVEDVTLDQVKAEVEAEESSKADPESESEDKPEDKVTEGVLNTDNGSTDSIKFFAKDVFNHFNGKYDVDIVDKFKIHIVGETQDLTDEVNKSKYVAANNLEADHEQLPDGSYVYMLKKKATQTAVKEVCRSFKSRKELAEAVDACKNNSQPYTIRRSKTEGFRYDLITEEVGDEQALIPAEGNVEIIDDVPQEFPVEYSPEQAAVMNEIHRIALDTAGAIQRHYGIDADPAIIVADIIRDLGLISGDVSVDELTDSVSDQATKAMFNSYNEFYSFVDEMISGVTGQEFRTTSEQKLAQAIQMLHGPNFKAQAIDKAIGSTAFLRAAQSGNVPYIAASDIPLLTEALEARVFEENVEPETFEVKVCEKCGKEPCECVEPDLSESLADLLDEKSLDVDTEMFDSEMNAYFNESYEDTVLYATTDGHVNEDGTIVLEGLLQFEEVVAPVEFTLTPETKITEDVEDKNAALAEIMTETFTVTNNLSEEKFEFKFSK